MLRNSTKIDALISVPLFRDIGKRDLALVARHAEEQQREGGDLLVRQGDFGRDFYLIVDGSARVERDREVVAHLGNGDFLGDMSLLDGEARSATVTTETPSTILVIHGDDFERILAGAPLMQRQMLRVLSKRIRALDAMYTVTVAESRKTLLTEVDEKDDDTVAGPIVDGLLCKRGHFNHPQVTYCSACGVSMLQSTRQLVKGHRPPVGILLRDDGATFTVDGDYVIGSAPESAEAVKNGQARPLTVSAGSQVGDEHALIHLDGWSIRLYDLGAGAATAVRPAEVEDWATLTPGVPIELAAGTRILVGESVLTFASTLLR